MLLTPAILVDTSLLIDFFRKQNKSKSALFSLKERNILCISVITLYEFKIGAASDRLAEYQKILDDFTVLPLDEMIVEQAITIYQDLKRRNERIGLADTLIAATARANALSVATLNKTHFERISALSLVNIPESS